MKTILELKDTRIRISLRNVIFQNILWYIENDMYKELAQVRSHKKPDEFAVSNHFPTKQATKIRAAYKQGSLTSQVLYTSIG